MTGMYGVGRIFPVAWNGDGVGGVDREGGCRDCGLGRGSVGSVGTGSEGSVLEGSVWAWWGVGLAFS
jgi:hypothetical protein